jgi:hypothetical protein
MAKWRPNQKQWLVIWPAVLIGGLSLLAGMIVVGIAVLVIGAGLLWQLDSRGRKPENVVVKSATCKHCGQVGEPHWAKCARCGAENWKAAS